MTDRAAGLLLHPTSLPGRVGVGDLGPSAVRFLDWIASAGQTLWQVLPLGPTGFGASPYGSVSAFAGNPLLLSPERLVEDGVIPAPALDDVPPFAVDHVEWDRVRAWKDRLLRSAWSRVAESASVCAALESFREAPEQRALLDDWARFAALRAIESTGAEATELPREVAYQEFLQLLFFRQWGSLRTEAARRGISIVGDVPIYVSPDSADVVAHPDLFALDAQGRATEVAGVPPDFFSETGQLWGYPLYRWDRMEEEGQRARDYLGTDGREIEWDLIRAAQASVADRAIVPVQDVFGLGSEARMNTPGRSQGNWAWRARDEDFRPERAARLR